jgi:aconitate hydratase
MPHNLFDTLQTFTAADGTTGRYYSLPQLEKAGIGTVSRLPMSMRVVLESVLRNYDGEKITEEDVRALVNWKPKAERTEEIPFKVARVLLQDFTGVPLLVDLAAMRSATQRFGGDPMIIEPLVPVDLVVDHSVQVDFFGTEEALGLNMGIEFKRNFERYQFLKWGMQAFNGFGVIPPGIGIVHQVNLEYLAKGVLEKDGVYYPDSLVGTDSHTTMINGLGVVAWGVGGIEAEAGMLGQPVYFLTPDVVGVHMSGRLREGVTATDLVLHVTEMLRKFKVVGKFVEFHGEGAASLPVADRATISNMSPEYGATMGYFGIDEETCNYLLATGRPKDLVDKFRAYYQAQGMFGIPKRGEVDYTAVLDLDLDDVRPSVAGPKRPQDRIELPDLKKRFIGLFHAPLRENGYGKEIEELNRRFPIGIAAPAGEVIAGGGDQTAGTVGDGMKNTSAFGESEMMDNRPTPNRIVERRSQSRSTVPQYLHHGDVVIAAITSCTNTSNPTVMIAAGLVAKKAVERGLYPPLTVKTSLAPGSRVVTDYLQKSGLLESLREIRFNLVGYGCTTCIGNSGPIDAKVEETMVQNDLVVASVLSGNRNFEARVHQNVKANFLMSPPLVVAFALAGRVDIDLTSEPLGQNDNGEDVYLRDIWPTLQEVQETMRAALEPESFGRLYRDFEQQNPLWQQIPSNRGLLYEWTDSTYVQEPPFFSGFGMETGPVADIRGARALAVFGDSVTTDHISPAGAIKPASPAGRYLRSRGVAVEDFNSYGSRRGNDRVMVRGTFANVRIKNLMVPGVEGGVTIHQPSGEKLDIFDAAERYRQQGVPLVVFGGEEYGTGSSRDWAAKGTLLLGVKAVIAKSFERIHRSNLVGMGVLPCQFGESVSSQTLNLDGTETFDLVGIESSLLPRMSATLRIRRASGETTDVPVTVRIDTPIEVDYYRHGGILPYVLRELIAGAAH